MQAVATSAAGARWNQTSGLGMHHTFIWKKMCFDPLETVVEKKIKVMHICQIAPVLQVRRQASEPRAQLPHVLPLYHWAQRLAEHVSIGTRLPVTDYLKIQSDAITRVYKMENVVGKRKLWKIKSGDWNPWRRSPAIRVSACGNAWRHACGMPNAHDERGTLSLSVTIATSVRGYNFFFKKRTKKREQMHLNRLTWFWRKKKRSESKLIRPPEEDLKHWNEHHCLLPLIYPESDDSVRPSVCLAPTALDAAALCQSHGQSKAWDANLQKLTAWRKPFAARAHVYI